MSFLKVISKEVTEIHIGDPRNGKPIVLGASPEYPLLVDPTQTTATEHFSVLRTRLLNTYSRSGLRSVVITSPQTQEGKSLVCTNLAICVAQLEKYRILLVDGDLRMKGTTQLCGIEDNRGLGNFLDGSANFEECIRSTNLKYLSVAGAGTVRQEALPGILEGPKWPQFLEQAKQQFELIIVDSVPAVAPIADFELVSAACDAILLVVHLRKSTREAVERTLRQLNGKLLGLIINNTGPRVGSDYYSYYQTTTKKKG
jgi:capsular exopolysaccharide synthesis family protein